MKKIIFVSAFLILSFQAQAGGKPSGCSTYVNCPQNVKNGPENCTDPNDKSKVIIKAHKKNGKLEGDYWCAKEGGEPHVRAKFKNDELDGLYEEYDQSLKEWGTKTYYKDGKREGTDARKLSEGRTNLRFYKNDQAYGFQLILDKDNNITSLSDCEVENMRKKEEECREIYIPGYEAKMKAYFIAQDRLKKADENKVVEKKFRNGKIAQRYKLVDGKVEGDDEDFYENGKMRTLRKYKEGKIQEETNYFDDGQMRSHILYDGRSPTEETVYYQNGKVKSEQKFSKDEKWTTKVTYKDYHDNGKLSEEGTLIRYAGGYGSGTPDGEIKSYLRDGEIFSVENYKKGKREGLQTRYMDDQIFKTKYDNGVLVEETILDKATQKQKSHKTFFPDGSIKEETKENKEETK